MNELEKMEMEKTRPTPENNWYQWYCWLIKKVPESMKSLKAILNKKANDTPTDYKPKNIEEP